MSGYSWTNSDNIVSIIIPTYNDSQYLSKALDSCVNQDYFLDVIIIDDCSTIDHQKESLYLTGCYNHKGAIKFIKRIFNPINIGLAASRNRGIMHCDGGYILPLDADDTLYPNVIVKLVEEIKKGYDIVYGNITDGTDERKVFAKPVENITRESFLGENPLFCTSMFTIDIWRKAGGYPMFPFSVYEDFCYWCKCQSVGAKFKYIDQLIYHHTNRGDSMLSELHSKTNEYKELARKGLEYNTNKNCFRLI